jgi:hypothetical protein
LLGEDFSNKNFNISFIESKSDSLCCYSSAFSLNNTTYRFEFGCGLPYSNEIVFYSGIKKLKFQHVFSKPNGVSYLITNRKLKNPFNEIECQYRIDDGNHFLNMLREVISSKNNSNNMKLSLMTLRTLTEI